MASPLKVKLLLLRKARCAECDRQAAIFEEVRAEAPSGCEFRDIDVDANRDAASYYRARMHPALVLEKGGHEVKRWTGVTGKDELLASLREHVKTSGVMRHVAPGTGTPTLSQSTSQSMGTPGHVAVPPDESLPEPPPMDHEPPPMRP